MTPNELAELLRRDEDPTLELKRDDVQSHDLVRELTAFLNLAGGAVLLGVDDSGAIVGSMRDADRLEVTSPGRLPNTVTPKGLRLRPALCPPSNPGECYARLRLHGGPGHAQHDHPRPARPQRHGARTHRRGAPFYHAVAQGAE